MPYLYYCLACLIAAIPALLVGFAVFFLCRNKPYRTLLLIISVVIVVIISLLGISYLLPRLPQFPETPYQNPAPNMVESDFVGTWEANYLNYGHDKLAFYPDGTFEQFYDIQYSGYTFQSPQNKYRLEKLPTGEIRLHLAGGRYFLAGESPDQYNVYELYDPFVGITVIVDGDLILQVRMRPSGEIILHHLWTSSDRGFALIGGNTEYFRRTK